MNLLISDIIQTYLYFKVTNLFNIFFPLNVLNFNLMVTPSKGFHVFFDVNSTRRVLKKKKTIISRIKKEDFVGRGKGKKMIIWERDCFSCPM